MLLNRSPRRQDLVGTEPLWKIRAARAWRVLSTGLIGGVLVTIAGIGVHQVRHGAAWTVVSQHIEGNLAVSDVAVRHLSNVRSGAHLFEVDLESAIRGVERHPRVRSATARRSFPSAITISVEEYEAVLLLALDDLWYVAGDGAIFTRADSDDLDYPILSGLDTGRALAYPRLAHAVIAGALSILDAAAEHSQAGPDEISEIRFSEKLGYTIILRNGSELVFGFESPDSRLGRLNQMLVAGLDLAAPQRIDLHSRSVAIATPLGDPT